MKKKATETVTAVRTAAAKKRFLLAIRNTGNVVRAAKASRIDRGSHYNWLAEDEEYATAFKEAMRQGMDIVEAVAYRLSVTGYMEPLVSAGKVVARVRRHEVSLLGTLLKAHKPELFSERHKLEHSGEVKGGVLVVPGVMSMEDWEKSVKERQTSKLAQ